MAKKQGMPLDQGEQRVREQSWEVCEDELTLVNSMLGEFLTGLSTLGDFTFSTENQVKFIQLLYATRSFNSLRCAFELAQMGYYTQAAMLIRPTLEDLLVSLECERDSKTVEALLTGNEEKFNFSKMAEAQDSEFCTWWKDKYADLSAFAHPRSPGLAMSVSLENRELKLGPSPFDRRHLLAVVHYLLMMLVQHLAVFYGVLRSKDKEAADRWSLGTFKVVKRANKLINRIGEELNVEDLLAMKGALLSPKEEGMDWEEYKKQRAARVQPQKG